MAYAQTNYPQKQGIAPQRYTIAQIGCFITSFSNIMQRFGVEIDPGRMNSLLVQHNLYIDVDDGVRDDVGWTTIVSLFPKNIRLEAIGNGAPSNSNSIVKFNYKSNVTGNFTTHFCLVLDARAGTIIDSWDGRVKNWSVYGGPVSYATYSKLQSAVAPTPQGDEVIANTDQATKIYKVLRPNSGGSPAEIAATAGKRTFASFLNDAQAEVKARDTNLAAQAKLVSSLQTALTNEKNKPAQTIVKEVEKIVEKIVEVQVPVEVVKEVEKPLSWQRILDFIKEQYYKVTKK